MVLPTIPVTYLEKVRETFSDDSRQCGRSQEKLRQSTAPRKNIPNTTFLLERGHEAHVRPQHGQDPQEEKQHKACGRERGV